MSVCENFNAQHQLGEIKESLRERGYIFHHHTAPHGRLWRNLFTETDEIIIPLHYGISLKIGESISQLQPFEEFTIPAEKHFSIIGNFNRECQWVYAYHPMEVPLASRLMRKSGFLQLEDYNFMVNE